MLEFSEKKVVETITVPKAITEDDICNIVVGAFEGGCNYWMGLDNTGELWEAQPHDEPNSTWATKLLIEGHTLRFYDVEDAREEFELTLPKLLDGIRQNISERKADVDFDLWDADDYDCVFQYGMFGKVVYC